MGILNSKCIIVILGFISILLSENIHLEKIHIESKTNGVILKLKLDSIITQNDITAWQATSGWFYITMYKVYGDTLDILQSKLPKEIIEFQAIQGNEYYQIGLRLRQHIEHYEFSLTNKNNLVVASLHYSTEYLANINRIKTNDKIEQVPGMPIGLKKWLYLTGTGIMVAGSFHEKGDRPINHQMQAGIIIVLATFIIDNIWKIL